MAKININEWRDEIYSFFGNNTFLKVKNSALEIGMVQFCFVSTDSDGKAIRDKSFDAYLSIGEALSLTTDILYGKLAKKNEAEKAKGEQYPKAIWESGLGGKSEKTANRPDGKAISRQFSIAPASKGVYVWNAKQGAGKTDRNGLIVPEGKPEINLFVPVMTEADMQSFAEELRAEIYAFKAAKYAKGFPWGAGKPKNEEAPASASTPKAETPKTEAPKTEVPKETQKAEVPKAETSKEEPKTTTTASEPSVSPEPTLETIVLSTYTEIQPLKSNNGDMCMQAINKDNEILVLIFLKSEIDKIEPEKWERFENLTKTKGKKFNIKYKKVEKGDKVYFYFMGFNS